MSDKQDYKLKYETETATEIARLRDEILKLRVSILHSMKSDMEKIVQAAIAPLAEKIDELSNSGWRKPKPEPAKVLGWYVVESGGYWRAFGKINGRQYGVYLGRKRDLKLAEYKIKMKIEEIEKEIETAEMLKSM